MGKISAALEKSSKENWSTSGHKKVKDEQTVKKSDDFARLKSLGQNEHIEKDLIAVKEPDSFEAEQFRKVGTNILHSISDPKPRCFLITSVDSGDGKTFFTANLAVSMAANLEEQVLLVDCDLRAPGLHKKFGLPNGNGITEHLIKGMDFLPLIRTTSINNLKLLPAGSMSLDSAKLLSSKRMSKALDLLKTNNRSQYIFIDAPPPLLTAESAALAKQVDKIIIMIESGRTKRSMVTELIEYLGQEKIFGVVLNKNRMKRAGYYKYSYGEGSRNK